MSNENRIYAHAQAGLNAYRLLEELAELVNTNGWVDLRRTMNDRRLEDKTDYPPVYEVWWQPNHWDHMSRDVANKLYELGDRFQCRVDFRIRDGRMTAVFHDDHSKRN